MELRGLDRLPHHMRDSVERYVMRGVPGGSFLTELFANRLVQSFGRADDENTAAMREWASWLYNDAPGDCWGSHRAVAEWCEAGGLLGMAPASNGAQR